MKKNLILIFTVLMALSSCSIFEDDDDLGIVNDLYLRTVFKGVIYDEEGKLLLNAEVQIDMFSEKDGEAKSRSVSYTDDFGGFTNVFKLGTNTEVWYFRLYVKPPRELERIIAAEGPVELGSINNLEINLSE